MTTQILSRKARISAIITALIMLLTALCYMARPISASADVWDDDRFEIDYSHVCTDACYKNIYYLTDNVAAEYYVNSFLGGLADMYAEQHTVFNEFKYYDTKAIYNDLWRERPLYNVRFGEPKWYYDSHPIKDALVIYELNELLPFQFSDGIAYQPTYQLYDIFYEMKRNDCKIMFICNTDETLFNDRNGSNMFLDIVDIHINTDIYTFFTETILASFTDTTIRDSTIILDRSMAAYAVCGDDFNCEYKENEYRKIYEDYYGPYTYYGSRYGFFDGTLLPHIRKTYGMTRSGAYPNNLDLLKGENIKVLCHLGEQIFYDLTNETMYYWAIDSDNFMERYYNESCYFIGSTRYGDDSYDLRDLLDEIEEKFDHQLRFDRYMFVEYNCYRTMYEEKNMKVAGMDSGAMASFISPIVARFLFDDIYEVDWSTINNWDGRCEVTVKPTSDDSWLLPLTDQDDTNNEGDRRDYYYDD